MYKLLVILFIICLYARFNVFNYVFYKDDDECISLKITPLNVPGCYVFNDGSKTMNFKLDDD